MKASIIFLFLTYTSYSFSCVWTKSSSTFESPFYSSNEIEVCFTPPRAQEKNGIENPTDDLYRQEYQRAMEIISSTIRKQINERTQLNATNFGFCEDGQSAPSVNRISYDLNAPDSFGATSIIGPEQNEHNDYSISMGIVSDPQRDKGSSSEVILPSALRDFTDKSYLSWTGLHEFMHSLGFQHENCWDSNRVSYGVTEVIQVGDSVDENSITNSMGTKHYDDNGFGVLSENDVRCVDLVASREILDLPSRQIIQEEFSPFPGSSSESFTPLQGVGSKGR